MDISKSEFISELSEVFELNGLSHLLTDKARERFYELTERMLTENKKYNLTAITEPSKIILNHYADCAALAEIIPEGAGVIDIGCGAGFPTLPVAILRPDLSILGVDSTAKRIDYVNTSAELLGLTNVRAVAMRAEDGAKDGKYRESFDIATARAVAELRVLCELCLPFVKQGGSMLAMKGKNWEGELALAKKAITTLGGTLEKCIEVSLKNGAGEELSHPIIPIRKTAKTAPQYPRNYSQISKKPL